MRTTFLDPEETTALDPRTDAIVEIDILDRDGQMLLDTLVQQVRWPAPAIIHRRKPLRLVEVRATSAGTSGLQMAASASTLLVGTSPSLAIIIIVDHTSSELGPFCDLIWCRLADTAVSEATELITMTLDRSRESSLSCKSFQQLNFLAFLSATESPIVRASPALTPISSVTDRPMGRCFQAVAGHFSAGWRV